MGADYKVAGEDFMIKKWRARGRTGRNPSLQRVGLASALLGTGFNGALKIHSNQAGSATGEQFVAIGGE